jgi:ribosomal protein S12 methylthiotransferase
VKGIVAKTVAIISLGCPKNLVDSERLMGRIAEAGGVVCARVEDAEIVIVNTCGFIQEAREESLDFIRQAADLKKAGRCRRLIVAGCLAQRCGEALRETIPEIDDVVGLGEVPRLVRICCEGALAQDTRSPYDDTARLRLTPRHYAYLRLSEGCNNRCHYCVIPSIRGPLRSKPMEMIVEEARELVADGAGELNLIAQDTTAYGMDLYAQQRLPDVIRAISPLEGLRWIRLLYTHPAHFAKEIIDEVARNEKICKYIDLPIQHINDRILERMGRRANRQQIVSLIDAIRRRVPGVSLRTSLIVGFPGETEQEFEELCEFVRSTRFERLGAFTYSREEGTPASAYPDQIAEPVKQKRLETIMQLQQKIAFEQAAAMVGRHLEVLIDRPSEAERGAWEGRTQGDAPEVDGVVLVRGKKLRPGMFRRVKITASRGYDLLGMI